MSAIWLFLLGYALTLLTPGPNLIVVASLAAISGLRGVAPLILGLCIGAVTLAIVLMATDAALESMMRRFALAPILSAGMLGYLGWRIAPKPLTKMIAQHRTSAPRQPGDAHLGLAGVWCGFCTSLSNPITGAYFTSQLLQDDGHLTRSPQAAFVIAGIIVICTVRGFLVAAIFSTPAARSRLLRHEREVRRCIAAIFTGLSLWAAWPVLLPMLHAVLVGLIEFVAGIAVVLPSSRILLGVLAGAAAYLWFAPRDSRQGSLVSVLHSDAVTVAASQEDGGLLPATRSQHGEPPQPPAIAVIPVTGLIPMAAIGRRRAL